MPTLDSPTLDTVFFDYDRKPLSRHPMTCLAIYGKGGNDRIRIKTVKVLREWVLRTDYYRQVQHQKAEAVHCFHRHSFWNG